MPHNPRAAEQPALVPTQGQLRSARPPASRGASSVAPAATAAPSADAAAPDLRTLVNDLAGALDPLAEPALICDPAGCVIWSNAAAQALCGRVPAGRLELHPPDRPDGPGGESAFDRALRGQPVTGESWRVAIGGVEQGVARLSVAPLRSAGRAAGVLITWRCEQTVRPARSADVPEEHVVATKDLLELFAKGKTRLEYLRSVQALVRKWTGCECIGVRLLDRQNRIPYECFSGFSRSFWEQENWLSLDRDECACIRVIRGAFQPQDEAFTTPGGSFACNDTSQLTSLPEGQRQAFRGLCAREGYRSVAIVPLRHRDRTIGAIHMADTRPNVFTDGVIEFLEAMSPLIGEAVNRFDVEESLRQTNELLERTFESIGLHVAYMDCDFRFIRVNRGYAQADGRTPDFFVGKRHFDLYPNAENEAIFTRVVRTGEPYFAFAKPFTYAEYPERGVTYWDWSLQPVRQADGQVAGVILCLINVTDRRRAQEALREREALFQAVFDQTYQFIAVLDVEGHVLERNETAGQLLGRDCVENRMPFWELPAWGNPDTRQRICEAMAAATAGELVRLQIDVLDTQGESKTIDFSVKPVRDEGGRVTCLVAEGRDITESRRLERQVLEISSREQRRIGQDLHDVLGQHLTGVAFLLRVLEQNLKTKAQAEAQEVRKISDLLKQAIVQARGMARGLCPIQQNEDGLMHALYDFAASTAGIYGIDCRCECEQPVLVGDMTAATHLYHIAQEAVNNAMKHGQASQILIRLSRENEYCTLSVRDNGVGIRADRRGGKGIGLSIMGYRAGMIGGTVSVERHPEGGTLVTCTWRQPEVPRRHRDHD